MDIVLIVVIVVWIIISTIIAIINKRRWKLGISDLITAYILLLIGLTFIGLAISQY